MRSDGAALPSFCSGSGLCGLVLRLLLQASRGVGPGPCQGRGESPKCAEWGSPPHSPPPVSRSGDLPESDPAPCLPPGTLGCTRSLRPEVPPPSLRQGTQDLGGEGLGVRQDS